MPRRIYYGWLLVITLGVTETISWGILYYAFTVFVAPMEAELGWSRGAMTGALSLALLLAGLAAVPVGRWLDRHGPRLLMTVGSCVGSLLVLAWAGVGNLSEFYLVWAGIGLTMAAVLYDPAFATATAWFERHRLRAITAITLMAGLASTIFIPLAGWLVAALGWRPALVVLATILAAGTILPHALLLRRRPEDLGLAPNGASPGPLTAGPRPPVARWAEATTGEETVRLAASPHPGPAKRRETDAPAARSFEERPGGEGVLRQASFRWLVVAFWLTTLTNIGVGVHLVPYLEDRGYEPGFAAATAGLIGTMQVVARLVLGPLGDRASPRVLAALVLAIQPVSLLVLLVARVTPGVFAFVVLFGAARGGATLVRPVLLAALYGRSQFASIAGVLQLAVSLAQALAPVSVGAAYDVLGTYEPILWGLAGLSTLAVLAVLPAQPSATSTVLKDP
jgi:MFS family permease